MFILITFHLCTIPAYKTTLRLHIRLICGCSKQHGIPCVAHFIKAILACYIALQHIFFQNNFPKKLILMVTIFNNFQ
jgi:hypothetical protein